MKKDLDFPLVSLPSGSPWFLAPFPGSSAKGAGAGHRTGRVLLLQIEKQSEARQGRGGMWFIHGGMWFIHGGVYVSPLTRTLSLFCPVPAQEGLTAGPTRLQPSPGAEEKAGKEQKAPEGSAAAVIALNSIKRHEKGSTPKKLQLPACPAAGGWLCACAAAGSFQAAGAVPAG